MRWRRRREKEGSRSTKRRVPVRDGDVAVNSKFSTPAPPIGPLVPVMPAANSMRTSGCLRPSPFRDEDDVCMLSIYIQWVQFTHEGCAVEELTGSTEADHELPAMPGSGDMVDGNNICTGGGGKIIIKSADHGGRGKKKFTDEQVRSMECMFEAQTMLEPRTKAQLAEKLGLQPRQVAVWFQNRRARWKSKQLEREYAALQAEYDALLSSFESLKREKQSLATQLRGLTGLLEMEEEESSNRGNSGDENSEGKEERDPRSRLPMEGPVEGKQMGLAAEGGTLIGSTADRQQAASLCTSEPIISGPAERECCFFAAGSLSDVQSCGTSSTDWWELWLPN